MKHEIVKPRSSVTYRLLEIREEAGDDIEKHARYHELINRYQRVLMKSYLVRYRHRMKARMKIVRQISGQVQEQWHVVKQGYCLYRQILHSHPRRVRRRASVAAREIA